MLLIFITEAFQCTDNRKRGTLAETAQSHALNHGRKFFQFVEIGHLALAIYDLLEDLEHTFGTLTARNAFTAALTLCKVHEESGNFNHTGILVHNYETARTHDRIERFDRIKVQRTVDLIFDQTSTGWSTDLYALECSAALETAADVVNDMTEAGSHRNFDKTGILDRTGKGECLGSRASLCSDGTEPVSTLKDDLRNVGISFYVIEDSWFLPESLLYSTRWFDTWHASFAFDGCGKGGTFTTNERTGSTVDM